MKPVVSKKDFVRRFLANEFGNRGPTWDSLEDFVAVNYLGLVHLRNRVAGGPTFYNLRPSDAVRMWKGFQNPSRWYCAAMAPTELTLFQGEVQQSENHIDLVYSTVAKPMREALAARQYSVGGIIAVCLMRAYLCPNSLSWLEHLMTAYPEHVIEFSVYAENWGTIPHYNTVFWEIRKY